MAASRNILVAVLLSFIVSTGCSKEKSGPETPKPAASRPQPSEAAPAQAQSAAAQQPSAPAPGQSAPQPPSALGATSTASPEGSSKAAGARATEKHGLAITNWAKTPVTATLNGEWIGQWDSDLNFPLDSVLQGKNQLTIEVQGEPKNALVVALYAIRNGQRVDLLSFDFNGKPGTHSYSFVAR